MQLEHRPATTSLPGATSRAFGWYSATLRSGAQKLWVVPVVDASTGVEEGMINNLLHAQVTFKNEWVCTWPRRASV